MHSPGLALSRPMILHCLQDGNCLFFLYDNIFNLKIVFLGKRKKNQIKPFIAAVITQLSAICITIFCKKWWKHFGYSLWWVFQSITTGMTFIVIVSLYWWVFFISGSTASGTLYNKTSQYTFIIKEYDSMDAKSLLVIIFERIFPSVFTDTSGLNKHLKALFCSIYILVQTLNMF